MIRSVVLVCLIGGPVFPQTRTPQVLDLPGRSMTVKELVRFAQSKYHIHFFVTSDLLDKSVTWNEPRMTLRDFVIRLTDQLDAGYIIMEPGEGGEYRVLVASRAKPNPKAASPTYYQQGKVKTQSRQTETSSRRPRRMNRKPTGRPTQVDKTKRVSGVPTAGDLQTIAPTRPSARSNRPFRKVAPPKRKP